MGQIFSVDSSNPMPLYVQLERAIRFAIITGRLPVGEQLPTVRQLAVDLRISANTVAKVYAELEQQGVLETRRGVGTFVSSRPRPSSRHNQRKELRDLADRFVAEAQACGFSVEDLLDHLQNRRPKEIS